MTPTPLHLVIVAIAVWLGIGAQMFSLCPSVDNDGTR